MKIELEFINQKELEETINELDQLLSYSFDYPRPLVSELLDKLSETLE